MNCRSCGVEIEFKKMPSGKSMPVDKEPVKIIIEINGEFKVKNGYLPHWVTCDKPDMFRKVKDE